MYGSRPHSESLVSESKLDNSLTQMSTLSCFVIKRHQAPPLRDHMIYGTPPSLNYSTLCTSLHYGSQSHDQHNRNRVSGYNNGITVYRCSNVATEIQKEPKANLTAKSCKSIRQKTYAQNNPVAITRIY